MSRPFLLILAFLAVPFPLFPSYAQEETEAKNFNFQHCPERMPQSSWLADIGIKASVTVEPLSHQLTENQPIPALMKIMNTGKVTLPGHSDIIAKQGKPVFYAGAYYVREAPKEPGTFLTTVGLTHNLAPGASVTRVIRVPPAGDTGNLLASNGWLVCVDSDGKPQGYGVKEVTVRQLNLQGVNALEHRLNWAKSQFSRILIITCFLLMGIGLLIYVRNLGRC